MHAADPTIRVYANGRGFVVVPVLADAEGRRIEGTPATNVPLTLGQPTALNLTKALRSAREQSAAGQSDTWGAWDGEAGKWWAHRLFGVSMTWGAEAVTISSISSSGKPEAESSSDARDVVAEFPADVPASEIAEWLIRYLGEQLN